MNGNSEDLFCVVGKAGSGKSTFMKFLATNSETGEALQAWLDGKRLVQAVHFFWIPGTPLQRTYDGLLRHLLYQCLAALWESGLETDSRHIREMCGPRWSSLNKKAGWSRRELKAILHRLGSLSTDVRFFSLIDGLDECEPQEHLEQLAQEVLWIARLPHVRLCVSCRPWAALTEQLAIYSVLHLDRLTYNEMCAYVRNRMVQTGVLLQTHPGFQEQVAAADELIENIVDTAEGVFLWVELAMRVLVPEIRKGSDTARLISILQTFPPTLDGFFRELIYERIPVSGPNVLDTASALRLAVVLQTSSLPRTTSVSDRVPDSQGRNSVPYHLSPYSNTLPKSVVNFWLLAKAFLKENMSWRHQEQTLISKCAADEMVFQVKRFLTEACRDLLVVVEHHGDGNGRLGSSVEFFHRSVFDFLNTNDTISRDIRDKAPKYFESNDFLVELSRMRCICLLGDIGGFCPKSEMLFLTARNIFSDGEDLLFLMACDRVLAARTLDHCNCGDSGPHSLRLKYAETYSRWRSGLAYHALAIIKKWPSLAASFDGMLSNRRGIAYAMLDYIIAPSTAPESSKLYITLLGLLSYHGANLKRFIGTSSVHACSQTSGSSNATIWHGRLKKAMQERSKLDYDSEALRCFGYNCLQVALLMIQHGAQPVPCIEDHISEEKCFRVPIADLFNRILPGDISKAQARVLFDLAIAAGTSRSTSRHRMLRVMRAHMLKSSRYSPLPHGYSYNKGDTATCSLCSEIAKMREMHGYRRRCLDCDNDRMQWFCHSCASKRSYDIPGIVLACEAVEGDTTPVTNDHTVDVKGSFNHRSMGQAHPLLHPPDADSVVNDWYHKHSHDLDGDATWSMENEAIQILAEVRQSVPVRDMPICR